jgi:hypothetical protein
MSLMKVFLIRRLLQRQKSEFCLMDFTFRFIKSELEVKITHSAQRLEGLLAIFLQQKIVAPCFCL